MIATKKLLELNNRIREIEDEVYNTGDRDRNIELCGFSGSEKRKLYFFNLGKKHGGLKIKKRELEKALIYKSSDFKNIKI